MYILKQILELQFIYLFFFPTQNSLFIFSYLLSRPSFIHSIKQMYIGSFFFAIQKHNLFLGFGTFLTFNPIG